MNFGIRLSYGLQSFSPRDLFQSHKHSRSNLNWADHVNYTLRNAWKALHFIMRILKKGNNNTERLACTALVRPILEYGAVCWDPYREGQVRRFKSGAKESG